MQLRSHKPPFRRGQTFAPRSRRPGSSSPSSRRRRRLHSCGTAPGSNRTSLFSEALELPRPSGPSISRDEIGPPFYHDDESMKRKKSYPGVMYRWPHPPVEVPASDFMTQDEAAERLGVSLISIGMFVATERIFPATLNGEPGVTRRSVEEEMARRKSAGYRVRAFLRSLRRFL